MANTTQQPEAVRVVIGRRLAAVAASFIILLSLLMALNRYLLITMDPLDTPALSALAEQLERQGENEALRQQLRELDLLARRAFFVRQGQLESGAVMLAIAGVVLVLALQLMASGRQPAPDPRRCPGTNPPWPAAARARQVIVIGGLIALATAWGLHVRFGRHAGSPAAASAKAPLAAATAPAAGTADESADLQRFIGSLADAWPTFRGPAGLATAPAADPPTTWDGATGDGVLWKAVVPRGGFNSPVVWGDRLFLSGADAERREVYCYNTRTGDLLWTADAAGIPGAPATLPKVTDDTGYAAPTLAVDGLRVIALFGTGEILGLDFEGRRLWARHVGTPANHYGHSSSLLILNRAVFVQYDHAEGADLKALALETGETLWETARAVETSWSSPILIDAGGGARLVLAAAPLVAAYDAQTGRELWSQRVLSGEIGSSPAYAAGRVFAANQYAQAVAIDALTGALIWSTTDLDLPDAGSPVATERHLFLPTSYGAFTCVSATDGSLIWKHDFDRGGYGSPVLAGDRLYWITEDGVTRIFRAAETFEMIAEPRLGEASVCTPALVGRRLYIRGVKHLFCIGSDEAREWTHGR